MASGFRLGVGQMFLTSCFYRVRRCWNLLTSKCTNLQQLEPALVAQRRSRLRANTVRRIESVGGLLDSDRWISYLFTDRLTGVTSFSHLPNLECLDISYNRIDSVRREFPKPHHVQV